MPAKSDCPHCPAEATLRVIGGKWKVPILWHLSPGPRRFCDLQRAMGAITARTLAQQLREMEADGVVLRTIYPQIPPKVEYSLTPRGKTLRPIVLAMCRWGASAR